MDWWTIFGRNSTKKQYGLKFTTKAYINKYLPINTASLTFESMYYDANHLQPNQNFTCSEEFLYLARSFHFISKPMFNNCFTESLRFIIKDDDQTVPWKFRVNYTSTVLIFVFLHYDKLHSNIIPSKIWRNIFFQRKNVGTCNHWDCEIAVMRAY